MKNTPWDERLRTIYSAMGFENGELLVTSSDQLRLAVEFIEASYDLAARDHEGFTPPW